MDVQRLTEFIWLINTGCAYDCHVYLIDGGSAAALIDCGTGMADEELLTGINATGCRERLTDVFITHYHADHAGGVANVRNLGGVRILSSPETSAALSVGDEQVTQVEQARQAGIYPPDYSYPRCHVDEILTSDVSHNIGKITIKPYRSPGHCDGHMCFLIDTGERVALCSGDAVFHGGHVSIQPIPDCSPYLYADTAATLASLRPEMLLPGHGEVAVDNGADHLDRAVKAFRKLLMPPNTRSAGSHNM